MKKEKLLLIALVLCSCYSNEELMYMNTPTSISLNVSTIENMSRGALIDSTSQMQTMGVYCAQIDEGEWDSNTSFNKMNNRKYNYSQDSWIIEGDEEMWADESKQSKYCFNAYSPYMSTFQGISTYTVDGKLLIDFTTPTACAYQPDLMIAEPVRNIDKPSDGNVELKFHHALAALEFNVKGDGSKKITKIYIKGIAQKGQLSWDDEENQLAWDNLSGFTSEFSAVIDSNIVPNTETAQTVSANNGYLLLIPQRLPEEGITAYVTIDDIAADPTTSTTGETVELTIPQIDWLAGKLYSYTINLAGSGNINTNITNTSNCYILNQDNTNKFYYIPIDGRINTFWGNNGYANNMDNTVIVNDGKARSSDGCELGTIIMLKHYSTDDDVDASIVTKKFDSAGTTAESLAACTNDLTNEDCTMAMLVDINSSTDCNVVIAVYKDGNNSGNLNLDSDHKPMYGDAILWSWHFWITDYNPYAISLANQDQIEANTVKCYTADGETGALHRYIDEPESTDLNLNGGEYGDLWDNNGIYAGKFIMDRNIGAISADYDGHGGEELLIGSLYYQHGRKDPFGGNYTKYLTAVAYSFDIPTIESQATMEETVETPQVLYNGENYWYSDITDTDTYLWNDPYVSSNPADATYGDKSLFDPSPLGWKVPVNGTWSNFDYNTSRTNNYFVWDDSASCVNTGRVYPYYVGDIDYNTSFVYYPANGNISYSTAAPKNVGTAGYCWSSTADGEGNGYSLYFSKKNAYPSSTRNSAQAYPVRAVQE